MTDTNAAQSVDANAKTSRLEAGVAELQVPEPMASAESVLLRAGLILPLVGIALMGVAWWGSAGTAYVADQIPMLISGGLIGLAVTIIGIGLFVRYSLTRMFRFWLARMLVEQQTQTDRLVTALADLESAVRENRLKK